MTNDRAGMDAVLHLEQISKAYPGVVANDDVSLAIAPGEIHALVGENGAGKSTLLSILYGLVQPDTGTIRLDGNSVEFSSPRDAILAGIGLVQQHFSVISTLTLVENLTLAMHTIDRKVTRDAAARRARELESRLDMDLPLDVPLGELPIATQQRAEVLKALVHDVRVLALDEPNALLTPSEWEQLAGVLRTLAADGVAIVLVSHKLGDVLEIADCVTVMRSGQVVACQEAETLDEAAVGELMVGARIAGGDVSLSPRERAATSPRLRAEELTVTDPRGVTAVNAINLALWPGEIVGLAGVEGSGQVELTEALAGVRPSTHGRTWYDGEDITAASVRERARRGMAYIPADRHDAGMVASQTVAHNLLYRRLHAGEFTRRGLLSRRAMTDAAKSLVGAYDIRTPSVHVLMGALSGGNQQKVVLARELSRSPRVIIACYPTRGLDFAATQFVRSALAKQRDAGAAVLFASVDLDELLAWTDRIVVMHGGEIVGELTTREANARSLGLLMGGEVHA
ncbi:MAG: ABC transporter ATP-binding protein [Nitriliruptoraceae bacterium]